MSWEDYYKEVAESAADLCQACASSVHSGHWSWLARGNCPAIIRMAIECDISNIHVLSVAYETVQWVQRQNRWRWVDGELTVAEVYAEAESMLRCGRGIAIGGCDYNGLAHAIWQHFHDDRIDPLVDVTIESIWNGSNDAPIAASP